MARSSSFAVVASTRLQSVLPERLSLNRFVVILPLIDPRYSGGDNPPILAPPSEDYSNKPVPGSADGENPVLAMVTLAGWNFQDWAFPNGDCVFKIDSMRGEIGPALLFVPLKLHETSVAHNVYTL